MLLNFLNMQGLHFGATAGEKYLPKDVKVIARIHGSLMLIDLASSIFSNSGKNSMYSTNFNRERQRMYLMEKFVLLTADLVISPSKALANIMHTNYSHLVYILVAQFCLLLSVEETLLDTTKPLSKSFLFTEAFKQSRVIS